MKSQKLKKQSEEQKEAIKELLKTVAEIDELQKEYNELRDKGEIPPIDGLENARPKRVLVTVVSEPRRGPTTINLPKS